jgi:hypothetical protein
VAEMVRQLGLQRRLQNCLGQPVRADQLHPSARACSTRCVANCSASISPVTGSIMSVTARPPRQATLGVRRSRPRSRSANPLLRFDALMLWRVVGKIVLHVD